MTKPTTLALFAFAALTMAITMPSCPGQQAMQQSIDELKKKEADVTNRLLKMEQELKALTAQVSAVNQSAIPMAQQVTAITPRIDALEAAVKVLQTPPPAPAKGAAKKRR